MCIRAENHCIQCLYLTVFVSGVLGLPLLCAGIVPSMSHLNALSVYSKTYAPGEKARLERVLEQRITAFSVYILLGMCFFCC